MLLTDKYAPDCIDNAILNKEILKKLELMSKDNAIPHLLFFGPEGCGKNKTINLFLEMLYGECVNNIKEVTYMITSNNNTTEVTLKQSERHIIIEPNNTNFDRYIIQDVVKEYAKKIPLKCSKNDKSFNVVLINNIDNMSYYAQTSLRRTMEQYSRTCRFIMWGHSLSKVLDPLRSRCYCFKLQAPTYSELFNVVIEINCYEKLNLKLSEIHNLIMESGRNIKKLMWILECRKINDSYETSYDKHIKIIVEYILNHNLSSVQTICDIIYKMVVTNISGTHILKSILNNILMSNDFTEEAKIKIIESGAYYDHNIVRKRRYINHIKGFIIDCMIIIKNGKHYEKIII